MEGIKEGMTCSKSFEVMEMQTAWAMGSGDLRVLATPALEAMMENVAMLAVGGSLPATHSTVGGFISVSHLAPTPVGGKVMVIARLSEVKGVKLSFEIEAKEGDICIGKAEHTRFIVERDKFMSKIRSN